MKGMLMYPRIVALSRRLFLALALSACAVETGAAQQWGQSACDTTVAINVSTATTTQLVALSGTTTIYVCVVSMNIVGTATAQQVTFKYGTGASCGTGTTSITGPYSSQNTAGVVTPVHLNGNTWLFKTASGNALCVTTSQAGVVGGFIKYVQY